MVDSAVGEQVEVRGRHVPSAACLRRRRRCQIVETETQDSSVNLNRYELVAVLEWPKVQVDLIEVEEQQGHGKRS